MDDNNTRQCTSININNYQTTTINTQITYQNLMQIRMANLINVLLTKVPEERT